MALLYVSARRLAVTDTDRFGFGGPYETCVCNGVYHERQDTVLQDHRRAAFTTLPYLTPLTSRLSQEDSVNNNWTQRKLIQS